MSVSIRLRREGAKNRPYYKVVVADSRSPRDGKFIEIIGTYDPKISGANSTIKVDRAEHWISRGAQASDTVRSLLKKNKAQAGVAPNEAPEAKAQTKTPLKSSQVEPETAPAEVTPTPDEVTETPAAE